MNSLPPIGASLVAVVTPRRFWSPHEQVAGLSPKSAVDACCGWKSPGCKARSRFRPLSVFSIRLGVENAAASPFAQGLLRLATAQPLGFSGSGRGTSCGPAWQWSVGRLPFLPTRTSSQVFIEFGPDPFRALCPPSPASPLLPNRSGADAGSRQPGRKFTQSIRRRRPAPHEG